MCEWTVPDEPKCPFEWQRVVFGLRLCMVHTQLALTIRDTVLAEKEGKEGTSMSGHRRPRRYKAPVTA